MENQTRSDLVINGSGSTSGGTFNKVEINGHGTVNGDLECLELKCNGHARIEGHVQAQRAEVNGVLTMTGALKADKIKISGKANVNGSLAGEDIRVEGDLSSTGDCEAESFTAKGRINSDGLLNAGKIDIELYGNSRIQEIGGEHIHIRGGHNEIFKFIKRIFMPQGSKLTTDTVEGNEIHLDDTRAKIVRGTNVTIDAGCEVDRVEYQDTYHQAEEAKVHHHTKV